MIILIQARSNSSRFPDKIYEKINGRMLIEYSIDAARAMNVPFVFCIPDTDKKLMRFLAERRLFYEKGSETDVLDRFYKVAKLLKEPTIIRLCADYLYETREIRDMLQLFFKYGRPVWGNGVWICSLDDLENAWKNAKKPDQREHPFNYLVHSVDYPEDKEKWKVIL